MNIVKGKRNKVASIIIKISPKEVKGILENIFLTKSWVKELTRRTGVPLFVPYSILMDANNRVITKSLKLEIVNWHKL